MQDKDTDDNESMDRSPLSEAPLRTPFLYFVAGSVAAGLLYLDSLRPLFGKWLKFDESMGHALLLALVVCVWLFMLRRRFDAAARHPSRRGALMLAALSMTWFLAALGDIELVEQLLILGMLFSIAVLVAGWRAAIVLLPALAMLLFCVPVWDELNEWLVDTSAAIVGAFFTYSAVTAYVSGNTIFLPEGTVVIAGGCSGLRYIIVGLALANLASAINNVSLKYQLRANALALALMLAVNWVRIIVIVLVAYFSEMQSSLVRDHETFGWLLFGMAVLPLLLYVRAAPEKAGDAA